MQVTNEMVDRALSAWFASPPSETDQGLMRSMRAALEAALSKSKGNRYCAHDDCPYPDCLVGGACPSQVREPRTGAGSLD
jgi:hypothetical protein